MNVPPANKKRRFGWLVLGLVLLLLQGILPGSLLGGAAGLKSAELMFGPRTASSLIGQLFALAGMITGLMVSAAVIMTVTLSLGRIFAFFPKRPAPGALKNKFGRQHDAETQ